MFLCTVHILHLKCALCLRCIKKFKATHAQSVQCRTPFGILSFLQPARTWCLYLAGEPTRARRRSFVALAARFAAECCDFYCTK